MYHKIVKLPVHDLNGKLLNNGDKIVFLGSWDATKQGKVYSYVDDFMGHGCVLIDDRSIVRYRNEFNFDEETCRLVDFELIKEA